MNEDIKVLLNIRKECCSCKKCPYAYKDEYGDYYCLIQAITGTYPDSWEEVKL